MITKNLIQHFFIGLLYGIIIWVVVYVGIYGLIVYVYLNPYNINPYGTYLKPTSFVFDYPLLLVIILAGYLIFFKKKYSLAIGIICGFFLVIGIWGLLVGLAGGI